jgi:sugar phosphate isomerase/epimerase
MEGLAEFGVSMTFDACNFLVTHQDPWDAFEQLRPYVANLHVKDAIPAAGDVEPGKVVWHDSVGGTFEGVPNGTGDSKLPEIIEAAVGDGFSGPLTIEHVVLDVSAPDTQSKYQAEVDRVRRLVASFAPAGQPS